MQCPGCGAPALPGAKFCRVCGRALAPSCPRCRAATRAGAAFCQQCGAALTLPAAPLTSPRDPVREESLVPVSSRRRGTARATAIIGVIAAGVFLVASVLVAHRSPGPKSGQAAAARAVPSASTRTSPSPSPSLSLAPPVVTAAEVWKKGGDPNVIGNLPSACPYLSSGPSVSCVASYVAKLGAPPAAIAFFAQPHEGIHWFLVGLSGPGPVQVATMVTPYGADYGSDTLLVNGHPSFVYPYEITRQAGFVSLVAYASLKAAIPNLQFGAQPGSEQLEPTVLRSPEGGERFVFDVPAINGCFACGVGYLGRVALDFRADGSYAGSVVLGICEDPKNGSTPVHLPACSGR